jgi:alpha-galactosidase
MINRTNKLTRWTQAVLLLSFAFASTHLRAQAAQNIDGYWDLRMPTIDGLTVRHTYFELHVTGETVTGRLYGRDYGGAPVHGTLKNGQLQFQADPRPAAPGSPTAAAAAPQVYSGHLQDGKLMLEWHRVNAVLKGEALRTTREAATPPAPLPLPAPRALADNGLVRTPPMGWNSWNKFAGRITADDVKAMADAMVSSGMSKLGYTYINIDDTWEGERDASGKMTTNKKFPDMKALSDYVHSKGLKIGIYSSPGPKTCAGYEGSFGHEEQDAKTFAAWGIDYLKYDLCSGRTIYKLDEHDQRGVYQKMGEALDHAGRPIVYSLCQYGEADVWKWGTMVSGNLWRTTGDIRDSWESMDKIGFSQITISSYTRPGHWNDPDMLEIGNGGMSGDEYRTHMSLWSMLAAPLIAGNDLRSMSDETRSILMNQEVIAIDQDLAAKPVQTMTKEGDVETLWRPMADGSIIVGVFNRGSVATQSSLALQSLPGGMAGKKVSIRDLWAHDAVKPSTGKASETVPAHGVWLLRIRPTS